MRAVGTMENPEVQHHEIAHGMSSGQQWTKILTQLSQMSQQSGHPTLARMFLLSWCRNSTFIKNIKSSPYLLVLGVTLLYFHSISAFPSTRTPERLIWSLGYPRETWKRSGFPQETQPSCFCKHRDKIHLFYTHSVSINFRWELLLLGKKLALSIAWSSVVLFFIFAHLTGNFH